MHDLLTSLSGPIIYLIAFLIIFTETGIVGFFFLPGDTLLFSLGLLANQGTVSLELLIPLLIIAGFFGNLLGYYLGAIVRKKRSSSSFLQKIPQKHVEKTEVFYSKFGSWTVLLSRFIPVVRTIAPFLAGLSSMNYRKFFILSLFGSIVWSCIIVFTGFIFGSYIDISKVGYISVLLMITASILTPIMVYISKKYLSKN
jgi:membrane-associated protein